MKSQLLPLKNTMLFRKAAGLFILCMSCTSGVNGQTAPSWVQFGTSADYANYDVQEVCIGVDTLGNVYTAGSALDTVHNMTKAALMKYNSAGVLQWSQLFDNANLSGNDKEVVALLVDKTGNSYVCGYGRTNGTGTSKDYLVMKYDNAGIQQWVKTFDGGENDWDYITSATFDKAGNIIVAGYVNNNGGSTGDDIGVVKYSPAGVQMWVYEYASNGEDRALAVASDGSNNIYVTGSTYGTNARDMITIKLSSTGTSQWIKVLPHVSPGNDERGYSIAADAAGNCYVTGAAGNWITMKYDPTGTVVWTNHYTQYTLNGDNPKKIMLDKNNDVIIAGDAYVGGGNSTDLSISKLANATGTPLWTVTKNNNGTDYYTDACLDNDGNVYVGGYLNGPQGNDISALIVTSSGNILWNSTYTNPVRVTGDDRAYRVAVDKSHNFYLAGLAERRGSGSTNAVDFITLQYSALITGIKENTHTTMALTIFPNPASDKLTVSGNAQGLTGSVITIINMTGEKVMEETLSSSLQEIDIQNLPKGVYFIQVTNEPFVATGKLIKE